MPFEILPLVKCLAGNLIFTFYNIDTYCIHKYVTP